MPMTLPRSSTSAPSGRWPSAKTPAAWHADLKIAQAVITYLTRVRFIANNSLMEKNYLCRVLADAWNEMREFVRIQKLLQVLRSLFVAVICHEHRINLLQLHGNKILEAI
jgi:hypothetical protein